jgi:hypothetical protein
MSKKWLDIANLIYLIPSSLEAWSMYDQHVRSTRTYARFARTLPTPGSECVAGRR